MRLCPSSAISALLLVLLSIAVVAPARAQTLPPSQTLQPLERFLAPDGTPSFPCGISASVDPDGWRMELGPDGAPRFVHDGALANGGAALGVVPSDANWSDRYGLLGVAGEVNALAIDGDKLYVGGTFPIAGKLWAPGIAVWNISSGSWSSLGRGVSPFGTVHAIAVVGDDVYVGGEFDSAGSVRSVSVARWDGTSWNTMDSGVGGAEVIDKGAYRLDGWVKSLMLVGDELYVAGRFARAGNVTANNIARWNVVTHQWSSVGSGVNGYIAAMASDGATIYVGGYFTEAGGKSARSIARWDAGGWSPLGSGLDSAVTALLVMGHDLYAVGTIVSSGATPLHNLARWDGSSWTTVGGGLASGYYRAMYDVGGKLYVIGGVGVSATAAITIWDGTSWSSIEGKENGFPPQALAFAGQDIYAGGSFRRIGGTAVYGLARWDGSAWHGLESGFDHGTLSAVMQIVADGTDLYASGNIDQIGGAAVANNIAKWDGTRWSVVGANLAWVNAFAVINGEVYVTGGFDASMANPPRGIARWDGTKWAPLGSGLDDGIIYTMKVWNGDLIVGGYINKIGGVPVRHLARWDGSSWSSIGGGTDSVVTALHVAPNGDLYVGGRFTHAGSVEARGVTVWNGSQWNALGVGDENGAGPLVSSIGADAAGNVYVGGSVTRAGSQTASGIARWDGTSWSNLGGGTSNSYKFDSSVRAMAVAPDGKLYVSGSFTSISGVPAFSTARWDGTGWSPLGSGIEVVIPRANGWMSSSVGSIVIAGDDVYWGGTFTRAGGKVSTGIARWSEHSSSVRSGAVESRSGLRIETSPNPSAGVTEIVYELPEAAPTRITIFTPLGRECAVLADEWQEPGRHRLRWDATDYAGGLYFCRLQSGDRIVALRILVDR